MTGIIGSNLEEDLRARAHTQFPPKLNHRIYIPNTLPPSRAHFGSRSNGILIVPILSDRDGAELVIFP